MLLAEWIKLEVKDELVEEEPACQVADEDEDDEELRRNLQQLVKEHEAHGQEEEPEVHDQEEEHVFEKKMEVKDELEVACEPDCKEEEQAEDEASELEEAEEAAACKLEEEQAEEQAVDEAGETGEAEDDGENCEAGGDDEDEYDPLEEDVNDVKDLFDTFIDHEEVAYYQAEDDSRAQTSGAAAIRRSKANYSETGRQKMFTYWEEKRARREARRACEREGIPIPDWARVSTPNMPHVKKGKGGKGIGKDDKKGKGGKDSGKDSGKAIGKLPSLMLMPRPKWIPRPPKFPPPMLLLGKASSSTDAASSSADAAPVRPAPKKQARLAIGARLV